MRYTKEEVFDILESSARNTAQLGYSDYLENEFNFKYLIQYYIDDCDLLEWEELSKYYADYFEIEYKKEEWKAAMFPTNEKTLEDMCSYISEMALKPEMKPIKLFGNECKEAAIFRYLKSRITGDIKELKPSSALSEYLENNYGEIMGEVFRLAPTLNLTIDYQKDRAGKFGLDIIFYSLLLSVLHFFTVNFIIILCLVTLIVVYGTMWEKQNSPSRKIDIKEAKTFRDLVYLIQEKSI